jgi:hypothetical protein
MIYLPASVSGTAPTPIQARCPEASSDRVGVLINSSRLLLTDEPTSHLDEDGEADIMELEALRRSEGSAFVLITHNFELAGDAQRTYETRQGISLRRRCHRSKSRPRVIRGISGVQKFRFALIRHRDPEGPLRRAGAFLWGQIFCAPWRSCCPPGRRSHPRHSAVRLLGRQISADTDHERVEQIAKLAEMALSSLQTEIQSISDLYQIYLLNAAAVSQCS